MGVGCFKCLHSDVIQRYSRHFEITSSAQRGNRIPQWIVLSFDWLLFLSHYINLGK
ncbi:hypothetical protein EXN66_Car021739 [Channa argus]|uniref:Uncharacterized protein n=1 Tax=Channa argus TaxID=215402 RepID=A0A6G1QV05_CHAAH|nr:hypothetical protein EXN66_Car021739 [Channa argus]